METSTSAQPKRVTRHYTTRKIRRQILEDYDRSGLNQAAFCREKGISLSTFGHWIRRRRAESPRFQEMTFQSAPPADVEIELPNRIKIRIHQGGSISQLAQLIREVVGC